MFEEVVKMFEKAAWHEKIRYLRNIKGLSQYEMADRCCTTQKHYWQWEKGYTYPKPEARKLIAKALEVDELDIFG